MTAASSSVSSAKRPRIAVVGGGGAGMACTWMMEKDCDVVLYERAAQLGGHAAQVNVVLEGAVHHFETGFEFFSDKDFPFFNRFLHLLGVDVHRFDLTHTFHRPAGAECEEDSLVLTPFSERRVNWRALATVVSHLSTVIQFAVMLRRAKKLVVHSADRSTTTEDFVNGIRLLTTAFKEHFAYPVFAAAWGVSVSEIKQCIAYHTFKGIVGNLSSDVSAPLWCEVVNGTQAYIRAVEREVRSAVVKLSATITSITFRDEAYAITTADGLVDSFDHVVLATDAEQASKLLHHVEAAADIRTMLSKMTYYDTTIAIHGDHRLLPHNKRDRSVINMRYEGGHPAMTVFKRWNSPAATPIYRTWIREQVDPLPEPLYCVRRFRHPLIDLNYVLAQEAIRRVQGRNGLWFAGAYAVDVINHESSIQSAIDVVTRLNPTSERLLALLT